MKAKTKVRSNVEKIGHTIAAGATGAAMLAMTALPTFAKNAPAGWDLTGAYVLELASTSNYETLTHSMVVTKMELLNGKFNGEGYLTEDQGITWELEGYVDQNNVFFDIVYTGDHEGRTIEFEGVIASDGSMSGSANSSDGDSFDWTTENTATKVRGIKLKRATQKISEFDLNE
ncbi:hypothetical protein C4564_02060 [Candidatus Microgenomates bacterium]|nr:MAG: hypothetical protein C4564_02060 [Candidatus Microgenomates bacterium]